VCVCVCACVCVCVSACACVCVCVCVCIQKDSILFSLPTQFFSALWGDAAHALYYTNTNMLGTKETSEIISQLWQWVRLIYGEWKQQIQWGAEIAGVLWSCWGSDDREISLVFRSSWLITARTENNGLWPVTLSFSQCMDEQTKREQRLWLDISQRCRNITAVIYPQTTHF